MLHHFLWHHEFIFWLSSFHYISCCNFFIHMLGQSSCAYFIIYLKFFFCILLKIFYVLDYTLNYYNNINSHPSLRRGTWVVEFVISKTYMCSSIFDKNIECLKLNYHNDMTYCLSQNIYKLISTNNLQNLLSWHIYIV